MLTKLLTLKFSGPRLKRHGSPKFDDKDRRLIISVASDVSGDTNEGWHIMTRRDQLTPLIVSNLTINWSSCTSNWYKFTYSPTQKASVLIFINKRLSNLIVSFIIDRKKNHFIIKFYLLFFSCNPGLSMNRDKFKWLSMI